MSLVLVWVFAGNLWYRVSLKGELLPFLKAEQRKYDATQTVQTCYVRETHQAPQEWGKRWHHCHGRESVPLKIEWDTMAQLPEWSKHLDCLYPPVETQVRTWTRSLLHFPWLIQALLWCFVEILISQWNITKNNTQLIDYVPAFGGFSCVDRSHFSKLSSWIYPACATIMPYGTGGAFFGIL